MSKEEKTKVCFVIAPIGPDGSADRVRSDQVLKHIIGPSVRECGYEPIRADHISEPGLITSQVIQHIVEDPLVIADLTGRNPNVFYELALRHAIKKPIVQIIHAAETIPFDVAASRTVHVDHRDLDSVAKAKEEITKQIRHVENYPEDVDTPISVAVELQSLRKSDNPLEKSYAEILGMLTDIRAGMSDMRDGVRGRLMFGPVLEDLMLSFDRLTRVMEFEDGQPLSPEQADILRSTVRRLERPIEHLCMESGMPPDIFMRKIRSRRGKE
ncbi:hypothetical protein [Chromobacterium haemolyticum]|uniref:hypothetical protein n=1 Tax=Chromobacterium haemolyticum TaxID=394935 RepID=UPI001316A23E|nr:hypothetical protein [Chromobacterium haemolyticum]BBH14164.1 hypothetical protein CH06BL_34120 [Chromobacterium haemolyticum]